MIWALVFAAITAVAVVLTTRMAIVRAKQLADAQEELSSAKEQQFTLDLKVKEQQIEEARRETAELEAIVAGRQLTPEEIGGIATSLKRFSGREIYISSYAGDAEAARLGIQIREALKMAGIQASDHLGEVVAHEGVAFGVDVSGRGGDKDMIFAISAALSGIGRLNARPRIVEPQVRLGNAVTGIMVALKPIDKTNK